MDIIEEEKSVTFLLPFKMKYLYVYNDVYFKNKGFNAKIYVTKTPGSVIKGGAYSEEKMKTLSIPYKYIYYIMEKIRSTIPSLPGIGNEPSSDEKTFNTFVDENKKENKGFFNMFNLFSSEPKKEEPAETTTNKEEPEKKNSSIFNMFTPSESEKKKEEPAETTTKKEEPEPEKTKSSLLYMFTSSNEPKKEEVKNSVDVEDVKVEINTEEKEEEEEIDTRDEEKLKRNSENLLFKIKIEGSIKITTVNVESTNYIQREQIINDIVFLNTNGDHGMDVNANEESQQDPLKKSGGVFILNNTIIVIGELATEEINKLKQGIEYTEAYNKLL
jgi:hypothetical protein